MKFTILLFTMTVLSACSVKVSQKSPKEQCVSDVNYTFRNSLGYNNSSLADSIRACNDIYKDEKVNNSNE